MLAPVAGSGAFGRIGKAPGVQLVAVMGAVMVPPAVVTTIVGAAPKPLVASAPIAVMVMVMPPRAGSGLTAPTHVGATASIKKVPVPVPTLVARSVAVATTFARPSAPAA